MWFFQKIYNNFKYVPALQDTERIILNVTNKLEAKINEVFSVLNNTKNAIEKYFYSQKPRNLQSTVFECLKTRNVLSEYEVFHIKGALNSSYSEENFNIELGKYFFPHACNHLIHFFYSFNETI